MSKVTTAKDRWTTLDGKRSALLDRARQCAALTIPSLCPPVGYTEQQKLTTPYQSLGARGVNNLGSKLLLTILPPNTSMYRERLDDAVLEALGSKRDVIEEVLRRLENRVMLWIETSNMRPTLHQVAKHLIVTGNSLLHVPRDGQSRVFGILEYVIERDPTGLVLEMVIQEETALSALSEEILKYHDLVPTQGASSETVKIFTHVRRVRATDQFEWYQEINGKKVKGSQGRSKSDECPYIPLRWQSTTGSSYGIGLVEEYLGDLISHEGISKAIIQFAAAAAKILFLVHPNASTDEDQLVEAESGEFVTGRKDDIDILQLDKYADFQVAKNVLDDLTLRLSHAFLLQSGTVRNAERVTAEEVRAMAQELESALGGVYTVLSNELQLALVKRVKAILKQRGELPEFPKIAGRQSVTPQIVTGFEALGRSHELNRLRNYFADLTATLGPNALASLFDGRTLAQTLATSHNVNVDALLKTPQQIQAEQNQQMLAGLAQKAAGPASGAVAKALTGS